MKKDFSVLTLERFETYLGTCIYSTSHGCVITVHTDEGDVKAFAYFNANAGDELLVSCQRSSANEKKFPVVSVDAVVEYADFSRKIA